MSLSTPGIMLSCNSTTVMFEPKALYTVAISRPIIPPPITNNFSGTSARSNASVESNIRGSSCGNTGILVTREPAAMMQSSNEMVFIPSLVSICMLLFDKNFATPRTMVTLRCFAKAVRPSVS